MCKYFVSSSHVYLCMCSHADRCNCCSINFIATGIITYSKCSICGVSFTAGQSIDGGRYRTCGSVVTCVIRGQSRYGRVLCFFKSICVRSVGMYAYIHWFNKTDYPFEGTPLVVRIRDNSPPCGDSPRQVVSIFDIDPSRVIIERSNVESSYYMYRIEGLDTILI